MSGPDVVKLQKTINGIFCASAVPESGDYDDATRDKVAELQKKLGVGKSSGEADSVTLQAFAVALEPKYLVEFPKVEAYLTAKELADIKQYTRTTTVKALQSMLTMAKQFKIIWEAHSDARDKNWFWSNIVDVVSGADFPDPSLARDVEAAAKDIETDARSGKLTSTRFDVLSQKIRDAYAKLDKYRDETFDGAEDFANKMETTATACAEIVDVLMAVETAGLSPGGQALGAGVSGSYKAAIGEVIKASKTPNYSVSGGVGRTIASGVINAGIKYVLKGKEGEVFLKKLEAEAIKAGGTDWLTNFIPKALIGGGQQMVEDGLKGLPGLSDPTKKFTIDDLVDAAVTSFVKGAFLKPLGEVAKKYGDSAGKMFKPADFLLPKNAKLDKSGEQLIKKTIEKVGGKAVESVLSKMAVGTKPDKFEKDVRSEILEDKEVKKAIEDATGK